MSIADIYNIKIPKIENIKSYYKKIIINKEYLTILRIEDLYYCYLTGEKLDVINNDNNGPILEILHYYLEDLSEITITNLFYIVQLLNKIEGFSILENNNIINYLYNYYSKNNYDELSGIELSMLITLYYSADLDVDESVNKLYHILNNSKNLMEIAYTYACLDSIDKDFENKINKEIIIESLARFINSKGYYISLDSQVNTVYSTYLGIVLHENINNSRKIEIF